MEWVETTARTIDEAKDLALDQLGVSEDDAEFEVLEEPRPGLFGRVRGEARVRARVRPTTPRAKVERRERRGRKPAGDEVPATPEPAPAAAEADTDEVAEPAAARPAGRARSGEARRPARPARAARPARPVAGADVDADAAVEETGGSDVGAEQVGEEAVRFLDGLMASFGLEATSTLVRDGDELEVQVTGDDLAMRIGPRGATLLAIQDLTRVVSQRRLGDHETRLRIDIAGYREKRRAALSRFTIEQAESVKTSGLARVLEPMPSADRKVIHDTVATIDGVVSRSEGDDPFRRVVIVPVATDA
jgi:spoIIIJ-associated protein